MPMTDLYLSVIEYNHYIQSVAQSLRAQAYAASVLRGLYITCLIEIVGNLPYIKYSLGDL